MTCLIPSSEVQCRQSEARKTLPIPVGKRRWQGLGSVSDHRTYHTPLRTTRKQHGQRGPKMKWIRAETAKNGRKYSEKVSGAGSHCRGRRFESDQVHHMDEVRFSNIFIEKRTSHFWKALLYQGFFFLYFGRRTSKIPKWKSIIFTS